jgi:hypothetical protein
LAGEVNNPGTYAKRTVNLLGSLDKRDAIMFTKLCGFCWLVGDLVPLIFRLGDSIYSDNGITIDLLTHLDAIGLIIYNTTMHGFVRLKLPKNPAVGYFGQLYILELQKEQDNTLGIGCVLFTQAGQQLARICGSEPVAQFPEHVVELWLGQAIPVSSPFPRTRYQYLGGTGR